jgi:hypothetical protein
VPDGALVGGVRVGGVDEGDARVERRVDRTDRALLRTPDLVDNGIAPRPIADTLRPPSTRVCMRGASPVGHVSEPANRSDAARRRGRAGASRLGDSLRGTAARRRHGRRTRGRHARCPPSTCPYACAGPCWSGARSRGDVAGDLVHRRGARAADARAVRTPARRPHGHPAGSVDRLRWAMPTDVRGLDPFAVSDPVSQSVLSTSVSRSNGSRPTPPSGPVWRRSSAPTPRRWSTPCATARTSPTAPR